MRRIAGAGNIAVWTNNTKATGAYTFGTALNMPGDFTVSYRTEGVKDVGTKVKMTLFKWDGSTWVLDQSKENGIAQKWDNAQAITFTITAEGTYTVTAQITKPDGSTPYSTWSDTTGPVFTRP